MSEWELPLPSAIVSEETVATAARAVFARRRASRRSLRSSRPSRSEGGRPGVLGGPSPSPTSKPEDVERGEENDRRASPPEEARSSLLSQALKTGTAESHEAAENVHFVRDFVRGKVDRDLYAEMVAGLYHTYVALERLLDEHAPSHFPTLHFPEELNRSESLREDMEYWHGLDWETKPECRTPSPAVKDYVERMEEVGRTEPLLLLSHAYTRYLGDLSGGKVLARIARRALNLGKGHDGLRFYHFEHIRSAKLFKDKYREALDELALDADQVGRVVAEANVAFALNMRVFEELDVRGCVPGARVRDVGEALSYRDGAAESRRTGRGVPAAAAREREAKCPFGFVGRSPHHRAAGADEIDAKNARRPSCPFVFLQESKARTKDWPTWLVVALALCWFWSRWNVGNVHGSGYLDGAIGLSYLDWLVFMD